MNRARERVRAVAVVGALACGLTLFTPTEARAYPITFEVGPALDVGQLVLGERLTWTYAPNGPAPERAVEHTIEATTFAMWSPLSRLTLSLGIPVAGRTAEVSDPFGTRIRRGVAGLGDIRASAHGTIIDWEEGALSLDVALYTGIALPTGRDDAADELGRYPQRFQIGRGSWDPFVGAVASLGDERFELDLAVGYTFHTEANAFDGGDVLETALSLQHRLLPWRDAAGADVCLIGVLETRVGWHGRDAGLLAPLDSGGVRWSVAPGLAAHFSRHVVEAAVDVPIVQPTGEHVTLAVRVGYRVML